MLVNASSIVKGPLQMYIDIVVTILQSPFPWTRFPKSVRWSIVIVVQTTANRPPFQKVVFDDIDVVQHRYIASLIIWFR